MTFVSVCQNLMLKPDKFMCGSHPDGLRLPTYLQSYRLEELLRDCLAIESSNRPDMSPSAVLSVTKAYRTEVERMSCYITSLPQPRAALVEVARRA
jgi:hypothetical protein